MNIKFTVNPIHLPDTDDMPVESPDNVPPLSVDSNVKDEQPVNRKMYRRSINMLSMSIAKFRKQTPYKVVRKIVLSLWFQVLMLIVILADFVSFLVYTIDDTETNSSVYDVVTIIAICFYMVEISMRLYAFGFRNYIRSPWNIFDCVIVVVSVLLLNIHENGPVVLGRLAKFGKTGKTLRVVASVCRCVAVSNNQRGMAKKAVRQKVSMNKKRYIEEEANFDLDLTYITENMIAMGVPASGFFVSMYRNPVNEVSRFFKEKHPGCFRIYNVCPELPYPTRLFANEVVAYDVQDHTPPSMNEFVKFLNNARDWQALSKENIIAVHCKGGKGRTGSLCSAWLMHTGVCYTPGSALNYFAERRTDMQIGGKLCGVETPSQVRYVYQLWSHLERTESWAKSNSPVPLCDAPVISLTRLEFHGNLMARNEKMKKIKVLVQCGGARIGALVLETVSYDPSVVTFPLNGVDVCGDVRISVFEELDSNFNAHAAMLAVPNAMKAKGLLAMFLVHTSFMGMDSLFQPDGNLNDLTEGSSLRISEHATDAELGEKVFKVAVSELDKAHKRVKKGFHSKDAFVKLVYKNEDIESSSS